MKELISPLCANCGLETENENIYPTKDGEVCNDCVKNYKKCEYCEVITQNSLCAECEMALEEIEEMTEESEETAEESEETVYDPHYCDDCDNPLTDCRCSLPPPTPKSLVAILSTIIMPSDGIYSVETLPVGKMPDILGVPHYVEKSSDIRIIIERLGARPALRRHFVGLKLNETALCFFVAHRTSKRTNNDWVSPNLKINEDDLAVKIITRIK